MQYFFRILFYILYCSICLNFIFFLFKHKLHFFFVILYSIMILLDFIKNNVSSAKFQHSEQYAFEVQAVDTPLFHWRFL